MTPSEDAPVVLADRAFATHQCTREMDDKLTRAWQLILDLWVWDSPAAVAFTGCLERAALVEVLGVRPENPNVSVDDCRGHWPGSSLQIWNVLRRYSVSEFTCEDLNPIPSADGSMVAGRASANPEQVKVRADRNFLIGASDLEVAGVLLHEMSHNAGFMHTAHEFGTTLHPLTVPSQVEACMATGVANPAPLGYPEKADIAALCANNPDAYWTYMSVPRSVAWIGLLGNGGEGPIDDSTVTLEGPAEFWPR